MLRRFAVLPSPWLPGHRGVDLATAPASPVLAPADGVVVFAGTVVDRGVLTIEHAGGLRTSYEPVGAQLPVGTAVGARRAGRRGRGRAATTAATRPCLHWGLRRGETYLDPLALVRGAPADRAAAARAGPRGVARLAGWLARARARRTAPAAGAAAALAARPVAARRRSAGPPGRSRGGRVEASLPQAAGVVRLVAAAGQHHRGRAARALVVVLATRRPGSRRARPLLGTGVLGGWTTFSAAALDLQQPPRRRAPRRRRGELRRRAWCCPCWRPGSVRRSRRRRHHVPAGARPVARAARRDRAARGGRRAGRGAAALRGRRSSCGGGCGPATTRCRGAPLAVNLVGSAVIGVLAGATAGRADAGTRRPRWSAPGSAGR